MRFLLPHVVVTFQQHAAALQHLQELLVHFRAQEFRHCQPRQQVDRQLELFLGAIERCHLQLGQRRLPLPRIDLGPRRLRCLIPHPRRPLRGTGASADSNPSNSPWRAIKRAICARASSTNFGLSTTSCRRLSTPTESPSSATKGVDAARFGGAGFSGAPPRRKIGSLGIPD
jgi:hypothetical protein